MNIYEHLYKKIESANVDLWPWEHLHIEELIPKNFKSEKSSKRTGKAGIFAGSLELVKEGNIIIKQEKLFSDIFIKQKNE